MSEVLVLQVVNLLHDSQALYVRLKNALYVCGGIHHVHL